MLLSAAATLLVTLRAGLCIGEPLADGQRRDSFPARRQLALCTKGIANLTMGRRKVILEWDDARVGAD
jgi:hypothetical protein